MGYDIAWVSVVSIVIFRSRGSQASKSSVLKKRLGEVITLTSCLLDAYAPPTHSHLLTHAHTYTSPNTRTHSDTPSQAYTLMHPLHTLTHVYFPHTLTHKLPTHTHTLLTYTPTPPPHTHTPYPPTGFWGDSDSEGSCLDLPAVTPLNEDKEDFDFYG